MIRKILGLAAIGAIVALLVSVPAYGKPVPAHATAVEHQLSVGLVSSTPAGSSTSHVGRDVAIGLAGFSAVVLVAFGVTVPRRRYGLSPA